MQKPTVTPPINLVDKPWGREIWFANNDRYCGKVLEINPGQHFSMHYHMLKDETWYLQSGTLRFKYVDTAVGRCSETVIAAGQCVHILPGQPHQLECISDEKAVIFEVSTTHFDEDSYRVWRDIPGE